MISVNNISVLFGGTALFEELSFVVSPKERIAIVGRNGAGKSTLLKLIMGLEEPSSGTISINKGVTMGYLPQVMVHEDGMTVYEECEKVFSYISDLQKLVDDLGLALAERTDYDSEEYNELIHFYSQKNDELTILNSGSYNAFIERTLLGLGFEREDFNKQSNTFSGGWRMRIELAKILLQKPDVLILDEPTNHLDIESIRWLEKFITSSSSALLLISHDKAFLNATTKRTLEIEMGKLYDYKTNYSHYLQLRAERLEQQKRAFENQQKAIQKTEDFIERFRYKATKSVQVQSRIKQLDKIERIELDEIDQRAMHFRFRPAVTSGAYPLIVEDLEKSYGEHTVFSGVNMTIERGEKVAFVGKNGAGKSTMIKCIMSQILDYKGQLDLGHQVEIAYFAQTQALELDNNLTVFETIDNEAEGEIRLHINDILGAFMFGGELSEKKVSVLSGGERGRLAMIKLLLRPANFLILDEPTNHLDIRSKEVLKEAILNFEGTVIVVSHDREFLDGLVDRVYEFRSGKVSEHIGGIYDWLNKKALEDETEISNPRGVKSDSSMASTSNEQGAKDYQQHKEEQKIRRNLEKKLKELETSTEKIEQDLKKLEELLANGTTELDGKDIFVVYQSLKTELETLENEWGEVAMELEERF